MPLDAFVEAILNPGSTQRHGLLGREVVVIVDFVLLAGSAFLSKSLPQSLLHFVILLLIQCLLLLHYVLHDGEVLSRGLIDIDVVNHVIMRTLMINNIAKVVTLIEEVL